ncbi:hypothetical protein MNBD_GAMMA12-1258 [hydrothermal vent metagenome]|uniref:Uncharacterized protein n=1 Tax=hydrothermal vent metagenome TaxID=652676 RepID=A0A3B0Y6W6_9ZZZZ
MTSTRCPDTEYCPVQTIQFATLGFILIGLILTFLISTTANAAPSALKTNGKIEAKSLVHATKMAQLYTKVRLAFINYDIATIRANSFIPKNKAAPPQKQMTAFGKTLPNIFTFTLVKVAVKGKLTGLWLIKENTTKKTKIAILFRFKKDRSGQWRTHPRTYQEIDTDSTKKTVALLIKSLKL